jgi:hypothetical protein
MEGIRRARSHDCLGGLSMAAVAGARRTQSSFMTYLASTNPTQLRFATAAYNPSTGFKSGYDPAAIKQIEKLAHVKKVEIAVLLKAVPLQRSVQYSLTFAFKSLSSALSAVSEKVLSAYAKQIVTGATMSVTGYAKDDAQLARSRALAVVKFLKARLGQISRHHCHCGQVVGEQSERHQ